MNRRGFTLLEMLASIAVAAITLVILASAARSQGRSAIFQMGTADMQQNVRGAIDLFTRELRMAGFGMSGVETDTLAPVELVDGDDAYAVVLRGNYGNIRSRGSAAGGTVTLDATAAPYPVFLPGHQVAIYSEILGVAEVQTISAYNQATGTITLAANLTQVYDPGSPVNQVDSINYRLDAQGVLWRGNDPMADQISMLQLAYVLSDGTTTGDPSGSLDVLRGAAVRMHATKSEVDGMTPQAEFSAEIRIRNLAIAGTPEES